MFKNSSRPTPSTLRPMNHSAKRDGTVKCQRGALHEPWEWVEQVTARHTAAFEFVELSDT
jgi:hypothetical protein